MKKLIFTCMMFTYIVNFAADNNKITQKPNADLIGSWQYKTQYYTSGYACYTEVEYYYFFSDNTCVKTKDTKECNDVNEKKITGVQKWMIVNNNVVLMDENGKQTAAFSTKSDVGNLLKGERLIEQNVKLSPQKTLQLTGEQLASK